MRGRSFFAVADGTAPVFVPKKTLPPQRGGSERSEFLQKSEEKAESFHGEGRVELEEVFVIDYASFFLIEINFLRFHAAFRQPSAERPVLFFKGKRVSVRKKGGGEFRRYETPDVGKRLAPPFPARRKTEISVEKGVCKQFILEIYGRQHGGDIEGRAA